MIEHIMKQSRKQFTYYSLLLAGIIIFFSGCKTSRQESAASGALTGMGKTERIESIQYQSVQFNTLSSSLRFSIKPGMNKNTTSVNAQLRIIRDKIIQLSLRLPLLGTEIGRITVTPEQILVIDRINKQYVSESIQNLKQTVAFDFDFYSLQALFTNQLFIAGKSSIAPKDFNSFNWSEDKSYVKLNNTDNQGIHYDFVSDFNNRIIQTEIYKNKAKATVNWLYKDFGATSGNRLFPMKMTVELTLPNDLITVNFTFNSVNMDANFELDTSIPNNYQPVEMKQIIKFFQTIK